MTTSAITIPLHRQLMLAQPAVSSVTLRQIAGATDDEELVVHRAHDERLVKDGVIVLLEGDHLSIRPRPEPVVVTINRVEIRFPHAVQTGRSLKEWAGIDPTDTLFLSVTGGDDLIISNDAPIRLKTGMTFFSQPAADYGSDRLDHEHQRDDHIPIQINRKPYKLESANQTGRSLKALAGIPLVDVLFLVVPGGEDVIITDDQRVVVKAGSHFFSQPAADYGIAREAGVFPSETRLLPQPDGWTFAILPQQPLSSAFAPAIADILVKLPPGFPDAAPDMFWVRSAVRLSQGAIPRGTSMESLLGEPWMRFSWHLKPGAWQPGVSDFSDFHRCIRARFERGD